VKTGRTFNCQTRSEGYGHYIPHTWDETEVLAMSDDKSGYGLGVT